MATPYGVLEKIQSHADYPYYAAMYDLLNTDGGMRKCRKLLQELGAKASDGKTLHDILRVAEKDMGLNKLVCLKSTASWGFLLCLSKKYAIIDVAAHLESKYTHGVHTHRLQWWLVYQAGKRGQLGTECWSSTKIGDLYAALGSEHANVTNSINGKARQLWDDIFDLGVTTYKSSSGKDKAFGYPDWFHTWLLGKKLSPDAKPEGKAEQYGQLAKAFGEAEHLGETEALTD